eukprot:1931577-Rhodomonas_salina.2
MQKIYVLVAFTMGSRAYGHDRCQKLGLTKWIPHSNIFGREDTQEDASGHRKKSFAYLSLCKDCQKHCVAVDDHPQWWLEPTFSWHHNPHTKKFKGRGFVLKICPFSFDKNSPEKNDTCLLGLGQLLEANFEKHTQSFSDSQKKRMHQRLTVLGRIQAFHAALCIVIVVSIPHLLFQEWSLLCRAACGLAVPRFEMC